MTIGLEQYPLILAISAFLILLLIIVAVFSYLFESANKNKLISKIRTGGIAGGYDRYDDASSQQGNFLVRGLLGFLDKVGRKKVHQTPSSYSSSRIQFLRAGLRGPMVPSVFWGTKLMLALVLPILFFITKLSFGELLDTFFNANRTIILSAVLALIGFYLPDLWLKDRISRRKVRLQHSLPDALDFLVVCVEAGLGLNAAISRVSEEIALNHKDLGEELKIVNLEIRAGKARRDALRNFALRTDLEDVRQLVTVLIQTERFGTSLTQALRVFSDSFRARRSELAEERAHKLPVKLVFPSMLLIFPSIFVVAGAPAMIQLMRALKKAFT